MKLLNGLISELNCWLTSPVITVMEGWIHLKKVKKMLKLSRCGDLAISRWLWFIIYCGLDVCRRRWFNG